jgi:hypothetical protein
MRPFVFAAVLTLGACAAGAPQVLCACQPAPPPPRPIDLPVMPPPMEGGLVVRALAELCPAAGDAVAAAQMGLATVDGVHVLSAQGGWLRVAPASDATPCRVIVAGNAVRLVAVDEALKAWAAEQPMTWNVRDVPFAVTPGTMNGRVRGIAERGEATLRWQYAPPVDPVEQAELRLEWTPAPPAD